MGIGGLTKKRLGNLVRQRWDFAKQSKLREVMGLIEPGQVMGLIEPGQLGLVNQGGLIKRE